MNVFLMCRLDMFFFFVVQYFVQLKDDKRLQ